MTKAAKKSSAKKSAVKKDLSKSYDEFKTFEGQQYQGMKVGRSHKWHYDKGDWKETKITPDLMGDFLCCYQTQGRVMHPKAQAFLLGLSTIGIFWHIKMCES
jgi:hypothetical protein